MAGATGEVDGRPTADTSSIDAPVRVWDLTTHQQIGALTGHTKSVLAVATAVVDGRPIADTRSHDKTVRVWDLDKVHADAHASAGRDPAHSMTLRSAAVAAVNGRQLLLTGGNNQRVKVCDPLTGRSAEGDLGGPYPGTIRAITTLLGDGQPIAVTGSGRELRIRNLTTGEPLHEETVKQSYLALATHTVKGKPVILAAVDTWLRIIDPETGRARRLPHPATPPSPPATSTANPSPSPPPATTRSTPGTSPPRSHSPLP
ncbi:WD40 repeat domain-containing protein [Streptomyces bobili]|uniref:WD40 repeat domain-containing protein n=1 Tax=Streptomyces bobili TaxID=67280 RepID=UPI00381D852A